MLWKIVEVAPARANPGAAEDDRTRGRVCHLDPIYFLGETDGFECRWTGERERANPQDEPLLSKQTEDHVISSSTLKPGAPAGHRTPKLRLPLASDDGNARDKRLVFHRSVGGELV